MKRRRVLSPDEVFPAGHSSVTARFVTLSTGVRVRVAESGPRDGYPLMLLHGWGASIYMYRHAMELLPARGVRTIAVDLRGYGLSDKPVGGRAYSLEAYCADLDALLDVLDLPRAALLGQSMGGGLALRYSLNRPERVTSLVLIAPTGLVDVSIRHLLRLAPRAIVARLGRRLVPRWAIGLILRHVAYSDASRVTERDVDEYWAPSQLPGYVNAARSALSDFDWNPVREGEAATLAVPALVILGESDRLIRNARPAATRLRGSDVRVLPGGHCVHEERPAEVYGIVGDFIARTS
jgi:pimeloyl-ACP methyl ester carboxylesterase